MVSADRADARDGSPDRVCAPHELVSDAASFANVPLRLPVRLYMGTTATTMTNDPTRRDPTRPLLVDVAQAAEILATPADRPSTNSSGTSSSLLSASAAACAPRSPNSNSSSLTAFPSPARQTLIRRTESERLPPSRAVHRIGRTSCGGIRGRRGRSVAETALDSRNRASPGRARTGESRGVPWEVVKRHIEQELLRNR